MGRPTKGIWLNQRKRRERQGAGGTIPPSPDSGSKRQRSNRPKQRAWSFIPTRKKCNLVFLEVKRKKKERRCTRCTGRPIPGASQKGGGQGVQVRERKRTTCPEMQEGKGKVNVIGKSALPLGKREKEKNRGGGREIGGIREEGEKTLEGSRKTSRRPLNRKGEMQ